MMKNAYSLYDFLDTLPTPETPEERALIAYSNMLDDISIALTEYRLEHGLSQEQLADKMRISQSLISCYERGSRNISIEKLCMLMAKLGKTTQVTFEDVNDGHGKETAPYDYMGSSTSDADSFAA